MTLATAKRFTLEEYHRLTELGFFGEGERVELIRGEIIQMTAKGTPHSVCNTQLNRELTKLLSDRATPRNQEPIILSSNSEPEPDYAIVRNRADDYLSAHPTSEDILLIIEIADSSLSYDQEVKLSLYAEDSIQDYWIFNLVENILEIYSEPYQTPQGDFGYRLKRIVLPNETISLPTFPNLILDLSKVFPSSKKGEG
jgi:Uma2 family endonuclease